MGAVVGWAFLLHGFVSTRILIVLSVVGPVLAAAGLYVAIGSARHVLTSGGYAGSFVAGLLLLAGAALTLAAQAPPASWPPRPADGTSS